MVSKQKFGVSTLERTAFMIAREMQSLTLEEISFVQDETVYWREAFTCILSGQVPYALATAMAERLEKTKLILSRDIPFNSRYEKVLSILGTPLKINERFRKYRFPNSGANRIASTIQHFVDSNLTWTKILELNKEPEELRSILIAEVNGFGPKQASMFLRNTAGITNIAILDTHILNYMYDKGLISDRKPVTSSTKAYEKVECVFSEYASDNNFDVGLLDYAIWLVMTEAKVY